MSELDIDRLMERITERPPGDFHLPEAYGPGWDDLYIGDKVRLGHAFLDALRAGRLPGVTDTGRKKGRGRVYSWSSR